MATGRLPCGGRAQQFGDGAACIEWVRKPAKPYPSLDYLDSIGQTCCHCHSPSPYAALFIVCIFQRCVLRQALPS